MTGLFFDLRKYSIHDGPGIRTAFFLKGCPLACPWCHNPEGLNVKPELIFRAERCLGGEECGACLEVCPQGAALSHLPVAVQPAHGRIPASESECLVCGLCVQSCPSEARQITGFRLSVEDVLRRAREDEPFYDESGGGVTFTGGEPLSQPGFLLECLAELRSSGIRTAVDTSGYASAKVMESAADLADLFLYDLKHMDSRDHERWTGVPNDRILENLRFLIERGSGVWVRIPLIPGVNDDEKNLNAAADFLSSLGFGRRPVDRQHTLIQILPYHESARRKYALHGLEYPFTVPQTVRGLNPQQALAIFLDRGLTARIGG